jgi:hypothetical protein
MIPGHPPGFGGPNTPTAAPPPTWQPNRHLEDPRRQMETTERQLQGQIDDLREQLKDFSKTPATVTAPSTEDI